MDGKKTKAGNKNELVFLLAHFVATRFSSDAGNWVQHNRETSKNHQ